MSTILTATAGAFLAVAAGLKPSQEHGFVSGDGRAANAVGLGWFLMGAYGCDLEESDAERVLVAGQLLAAEREAATVLHRLRKTLDDESPTLLHRARYVKLLLRSR